MTRGGRLLQLVRLARGLPGYLWRPMTLEQARRAIAWRMAHRPANFLAMAKRLIYAHPNSPYRQLLSWAGWDYARLEDAVTRLGIERTLEALRDAGVYVTLEEFKSSTPIVRHDLTIHTSAADFNPPQPRASGVEGTTGASRSAGVRVGYDWDFLAEEAANEVLYYEAHGLLRAPEAFWFPVPPAMSGIHHLLLHAKFRHLPRRWFSHVTYDTAGRVVENRLAAEYIVWCARALGLPVPRPTCIGIDQAAVVAAWVARTARRHGTCVLKAYVSSAVRVAQAAKRAGIDLRGAVILTGAEPLTDRRREFIESAGATVFSRYVATETGLIGASCPHRASTDDMHVYLDRLALIQRTRDTRVGGHRVDAFLFTSLSSHAGKVLFNTELGDFGRLSTRPCPCAFGALGMHLRMADVRSHDKLTGEGMTLLGSDLEAVVGALIAEAGGGPDDYQFWETHDAEGLSRLVIAISPALGGIDADGFLGAVWQRLARATVSTQLVSSVWRQADTLTIVRAHPKISRGHKHLPIAAPALLHGHGR